MSGAAIGRPCLKCLVLRRLMSSVIPLHNPWIAGVQTLLVIQVRFALFGRNRDKTFPADRIDCAIRVETVRELFSVCHIFSVDESLLMYSLVQQNPQSPNSNLKHAYLS